MTIIHRHANSPSMIGAYLRDPAILPDGEETNMTEWEAREKIEANAFAMELLIPTEFIKADLAKLGGIDIEDDSKVAKLAKKYRVSVQVMTLRLGQLMTKL